MTEDEIGEMLEQSGMNDEAIDDYFEHSGVKGMKWGQRRAKIRSAKGDVRFGNRNNDKIQRSIDRQKQVSLGNATLGGKLAAGHFSKRGARKGLERAEKLQRKIDGGRKITADALMRLQGVDVRELNYKV